MLEEGAAWGTCYDVVHNPPNGVASLAPTPPAQAYNKRATVLFLLQRFEEAIADCRVAMQMNVSVLVGCPAGSCCLSVHVLAPMLAPSLLACLHGGAGCKHSQSN